VQSFYKLSPNGFFRLNGADSNIDPPVQAESGDAWGQPWSIPILAKPQRARLHTSNRSG
jgi:hypothetical protein